MLWSIPLVDKLGTVLQGVTLKVRILKKLALVFGSLGYSLFVDLICNLIFYILSMEMPTYTYTIMYQDDNRRRNQLGTILGYIVEH